MSTTEVIIAGFGGQGILFMGQMLAHIASDLGKKVSWLPSYGPEMRGGTANCMICISDQDVNSPLVLEPDILVSMNKPSLLRFETAVKKGGTIILNKDLIDIKPKRSDLKVHWVPADSIALELGNPKIANMAALGALIGILDIISIEQSMDTIELNTPPSKINTLSSNLRALRLGYNLSVDTKTVPVGGKEI